MIDNFNVDYEATSMEVIFSSSLEELITVAFNISITDDTTVESNEQFEVFLSSGQEAVVIEMDASSAIINIDDDDSKLCMLGINQLSEM